jgi:hypothetical protein
MTADVHAKMEALPDLRKPRVLVGMKRLSFDHWPAYIGDTCRAAFRGEKPWPLVFLGEPGVGKTTAMFNMLDPCGGRYWTFEAWLREKPPPYDAWRKGGYWEQFHPHGYKGLSVMDDVGSRDERSTWGTHIATLQECLDIRKGWPTLLISNRTTVDEWQSLLGAAVASRVRDGTVVLFPPGDHRRGVVVRAGDA